VLDAASITIDHWAFWCILGLFIASEWMTRREVIEQIAAEVAALKQKNKDTP
jgi:hypothetical protein